MLKIIFIVMHYPECNAFFVIKLSKSIVYEFIRLFMSEKLFLI